MKTQQEKHYDSPYDKGLDVADDMVGIAVNMIDARFGTGYAERHPELIAGFIQAAAINSLGDRLVSEMASHD